MITLPHHVEKSKRNIFQECVFGYLKYSKNKLLLRNKLRYIYDVVEYVKICIRKHFPKHAFIIQALREETTLLIQLQI